MGLENIGSVDILTYQQGIYNSADAKKTKKKSDLIFIKLPDGKITIMKKEDYIKYLLDLQKRSKPQKDQKPYELGPEKNGKRFIDVDNVSSPLKPGSTAPKENSCPPEKLQEYEEHIVIDNGQIDDFKQGKRGDCYLLSSIESIKSTKEGQEVLAKNIKKNEDGSFTVTLPGAVAARNHYEKIGNADKCAITGQYTITKAALEKAKSMSGKSYAYGDLEVIALELAMEAFRAEVVQTNKALGQKSKKYIAGQFGPMSESDTLSGGQMYDAIFILTGQKSDVYEAKKSKRRNAKLYKYGEYGFVGDNRQKIGNGLGIKAGPVEVNNIYNKESDLQRMLDKYKGKEGQYSITVGVIVAKNGPDGSTKAGGGHALTVTKITDDYVEVVNPWDTTKPERIPRGDFELMAVQLNVAPVSLKSSDKIFEENGLNPGKENPFSFNPFKFLENLIKPGILTA